MPLIIYQRCPTCGQLKQRDEFPKVTLPAKGGKHRHTHGEFCFACLKADPNLPRKFHREPSPKEFER